MEWLAQCDFVCDELSGGDANADSEDEMDQYARVDETEAKLPRRWVAEEQGKRKRIDDHVIGEAVGGSDCHWGRRTLQANQNQQKR